MKDHSDPHAPPLPGAERPRRRYDATRRRAAAAERRVRIVDVAVRLFSEQGWSRTTIAQVAAEAGVSSELVSSAFGSKSALLFSAFQHVGFGGEGVRLPVALRELDLESRPDVESRIAAYVDFTMRRMPPMARLVAVIEIAADQDPSIIERYQDAQDKHEQACRYLVDVLATGETRPEAVEELFLITRAQTYLVLTVNRSWDDEQYAAWLRRSIAAVVAPAA